MNAKLMMGVVAAVVVGAMAEITNTVKVTKFHQSYPYSGKATVEYTVGGTLPVNAIAEITINTDDASATFTQSNIVTGANSYVIDFASSFGGAQVLTNASFVVTIAEGAGGGSSGGLGGVQLWENGPYWAECNVGATKPEEYGYYFWWGDTVGYTRSGGTWTDWGYGDGSGYYSGVTWVSSTGQQMSSSPFDWESCPTNGKDNSALQSAGYIDSTGNLVAAHDAATVHLGAPWRMPTSDEVQALVDNCSTTWITTNGVPGRLVTGKGNYANRSIFLPAAGSGGYGSRFYGTGSFGQYLSSTPDSVNSDYAWYLFFQSSHVSRGSSSRSDGQSVRPVRGFAEGISAFGIVTYDLPPVTETQTTPVPVPYAWLDAYVPGVAHEAAAYEATAKATAANGRPVWACYALGLDPLDATSDFRIASFPMKADGTPDFANVAVDPPQAQWNVPDAPVTWKGASTLEGPWRTVTEEVGRGVSPSRGSPGTARPTVQFYKAVVFGDADEDLGGVQLWEGGPYWAECNVGATKPEEYGYYFWWGDTVGYTNTGSGWISVKDGTSISFTDSGTAASTYGKGNSALQTAGYIDSTGSLVAAHDAATAHLGAPWRMPTSDEIQALVDNCTTTWITTNGVSGRLVTGEGEYANRSIFLPAAGRGLDSDLNYPGSSGYFWSSTPYSDFWYSAWYFHFDSGNFYWSNYGFRYFGQSVRPVRGFAE